MIISNTNYPIEIINIGGELMTIFLIISIVISLLLIDTKYWNKYISGMLDTCSNPLLLIFAIIVIFRIMLVI